MAAVQFKSESGPKNSTGMVDAAATHSPTTVGEAFRDYLGRRAAIIKALTTDIREFIRQCDPDKDALCLYGLPDGDWKVGPPIDYVPPERPQPATGINRGRTTMQLNDWLSLVARHSDAWLLSLTFHTFNRPARERLFDMINARPTVSETVNRIVMVEELQVKSPCRKCTVVEVGATQVATTVEEVFRDFSGRRAGIIRALTTDLEELFRQCDPDKSELCLIGLPDGRWKVAPPTKEVCQMPEPAVGINFGRVGIPQSDWLLFVAVHSDAWLMSMAFHPIRKFDKSDRQRLFEMINELPTVVETMGGIPRAAEDRRKSEEEDDSSLCGICEEKYEKGEFWICCDYCEVWYHGECVGVTPAQAKRIDKYKCPDKRRCARRSSRVLRQ